MNKRAKLLIIVPIVGIFTLIILVLAVLMISSVYYNKSNQRNKPHSYLTEVSVEVNKPVHYVYQFVKYKKPEIYKELSGMHNQFRILNSDGLAVGAEVECIEGDEEDIVHHRYIVKQDIADTLIQYESTPSEIYDKETNKKIGECNTYVYYDFIGQANNRTIIKQTIIIDMLNPFYKAIGDIIGWVSGSKDTWSRQFQEELDVLKQNIET